MLNNFIFPNLSSLVFVVMSFMLGILSRFFQLSIFDYILCGALCLLFMVTYRSLTTTWNLFLPFLLIIFLAGAFRHYQQEQAHVLFSDLVHNNIFDARGSIASIEKIDHPRFRFKITVYIDTIKINDMDTYCPGVLQLYTIKHPYFLVDDRVEIYQLKTSAIKNNSYKRYLIKEKISATIFIQKALNYQIIYRPTFSLHRTIFHVRDTIFSALRKYIDRFTFSLFSQIFLGNKNLNKKQLEKIKDLFAQWGISHYLARSGLHLVIFIIIWNYLLSCFPIPFFLNQILLIMLILIYSLLSWSSISYERALFMFLIYKLSLLAHRPCHYIHLIFLVTGLVLLFNPYQLFFLDFQLSFGLTLALAWFTYIEANKKLFSQKSCELLP